MFVRLTRAKRLGAGWFVTLVYLLCVLAPSISFALPGSHAIAPCLTEVGHVPGMTHVRIKAPIQHVHMDGHVHDHSAAQTHVSSGDQDRSMTVAVHDRSVPEKAPHSSDGQCCGLMCVTALPATLIDVVKPSAPTALCEVEGCRKVTDNASPRLYRPPIS
jgi:hypothetical protein